MPESLGARLRQRRERQQIALATIAEQTKIKVSLLEGLERDDVSHWPEGIFRRAFIRAYAQAIHLDPEVVVREFLTFHADPADGIPAASGEAAHAGERAKPPTRLQFLVGSAIGSLSRGRDAGADKPVSQVDVPAPAPADVPPATAPAPFEPDLAAAARLCTELGRADKASEVAALLPEAARILEAVGVVLWVWESNTTQLKPVLAHG
jgi:cytoskeleton protein RodZ